MSKRITRVNELLRREIGEQMLRHYGGEEAVKITISEVDTSPDLRLCRIYYSVIGDASDIAAAAAYFKRIGKDLRQRVSKRVVLKYFPRFEFHYDASMKRGAGILDLLDELDQKDD